MLIIVAHVLWVILWQGGGWMLAAKMKDPQSGWSDSGSAEGQTSNIRGYSEWGDFDSSWWTQTTGATEPSTADVADTNSDFKSQLFNYYSTGGGVARHDSAEHFSRLNALLFTATDWIFITVPYCFAIP